MHVSQLFSIPKALDELQKESMDLMRLCSGINSVKLFVEIYEILGITCKIHEKFNQRKIAVYDVDLFGTARDNLSRIIILNDPKPINQVHPYRNKFDKTIHYYKWFIDANKTNY